MLTTAASQAVPNATPARWSRADRSSEISVAVPFDGVGPYPLIENGSLQTVARRSDTCSTMGPLRQPIKGAIPGELMKETPTRWCGAALCDS
jgi:hypothetical protein